MSRIALVAVLFSLGSLGTCWSGTQPAKQQAGPLDPPPAKVIVGKKLKWRTLYSRKYANNKGGTIGELLNGSFSAAGKSEVLLFSFDDAIAFNTKGKTASFAFGSNSITASYRTQAWDVDGDGIFEIVERPEHFTTAGTANTPIQTTKTWRLDGMPGPQLDKGVLNSLVGAHSRPRDYDGDGRLDLAIKPNRKGGEVSIYGPGPRLLATIPSVQDWRGSSFFADTDGDGRSELVEVGVDDDQVHYYDCRTGQQPKLLMTRASDKSGVLDCFDLNGDRIDELILSEYILDLKTKTAKSLQFPGGTAPQNSIGIRPVECGKFVRGEDTLVAMTVSPLRFGRTGLCMFRKDGTCAYYEEFGERVSGLAKLVDGEKEYLVVQFQEKILIYP